MIGKVSSWLSIKGLAGVPETELLAGFCERCADTGLSLSEGLVFIDTLHPIFEGWGCRWKHQEGANLFEYGRTDQGEAAAGWQRTPFYGLLQSGETECRIKLHAGERSQSRMIDELVSDGNTDYLAFVHRFATEATIGEMDCVYSHWATRAPGGFRDADLTHLRSLIPILALAMKSAALARIARTVATVYLGRDAGARVLSGRILRGMTEQINAVLWFSDLRGYTSISDAADPSEIIPLLNDYAEVAITAIHDAGGDVLKLVGDGVLAMFAGEDAAMSANAALEAENRFRREIWLLNKRRKAEGRPTTTAYVGLHIGDVFYGNIGSDERLDFTMVGPAVNEVSRIASLCRSVDRDLLVSSAFREALPLEASSQFVSTGRYALRGVSRAQDLFTLDPALRDPRRRAD